MLQGGIHHVGSTAVLGLAAKPILDMIAGVRDLAAAAPAITALRGLSYARAPHRPDALWFYKPAPAGPDVDFRDIVSHRIQPGDIASGEGLQIAADKPGLLGGRCAAYLQWPGTRRRAVPCNPCVSAPYFPGRGQDDTGRPGRRC